MFLPVLGTMWGAELSWHVLLLPLCPMGRRQRRGEPSYAARIPHPVTSAPAQGPAGKDGLPGHPGQRGEPVGPLLPFAGVGWDAWQYPALTSPLLCRGFMAKPAPPAPQGWWDPR